MRSRKKIIHQRRLKTAANALLYDDGTIPNIPNLDNITLEMRIAMLDGLINNEESLHNMTSLNFGQFKAINKEFLRKIKQNKNMPLFRILWHRRSDRGNRCKLLPRHLLLMTIVRLRVGETQAELSTMFGIDQTTVSRYLKLGNKLIRSILPIAKKMEKKIRDSRTDDDFKVWADGKKGGTIIIDGTYVSVLRSKNKNRRKKMYSGKRKTFSYNVTMVSSMDGLILSRGRLFPGRAHDMTMLKKNPPKFGKWLRMMMNPRTREDRRITIYVDLGYLGLKKVYLGSNVIMPMKKPKDRDLTPDEEEKNREISAERVKIEHAIGRMKFFKIIKRKYERGLKDLEHDLDAISGLVNLHILWPQMGKLALNM